MSGTQFVLIEVFVWKWTHHLHFLNLSLLLLLVADSDFTIFLANGGPLTQNLSFTKHFSLRSLALVNNFSISLSISVSQSNLLVSLLFSCDKMGILIYFSQKFLLIIKSFYC